MITRFSKAEKIFLLSATVAAVCSAAYLFAPSDQIIRFEDQSKSLGFIKPSGHDVRIRTESENDWNQVDRDINIYTNDRLFTGSGSTAVVNIKNKQKFTVEPNSLIVLSSRENTIDIELKDGGFLGEVQKGVKLVVRQKGRITEINGDDTIVKLNSTSETSMKIVVLQGEARVKTSDVKELPPQEKNVAQSDVEKETNSDSKQEAKQETKQEDKQNTNEQLKTAQAVVTPPLPASEPQEVIIKANNEAKITLEKIEVHPLQIYLNEPVAGSTVWLNENKVQFSWSAKGDNLNNKKFILEVSADPQFKTELQKTSMYKIGGEVYQSQLKLEPGNVYFWRVRVDKDSTINSPVSNFSFEQLLPPVVQKYSELETEFNYKNQTKEPYKFSWIDPTSSQSYLFELAEDDKFNQIIASEKSQKSEVSLSNLKKGEYFWRVTSKFEGRKDLISPTATLILKGKQNFIMPSLSTSAETPVSRTVANESDEKTAPIIETTTTTVSTVPTTLTTLAVVVAESANMQTDKQLQVIAPLVVTTTSSTTTTSLPVKEKSFQVVENKPLPVVSALAIKQKLIIARAPLDRPHFVKDKYQFMLDGGYAMGKEIPSGFVFTSSPEFKFSKVDGADEYEIEISEFDDFHLLEFKDKFKASKLEIDKNDFISWHWQKARAGLFYIRLSVYRKALEDQKSDQAMSSASEVQIVLPAPILKPIKINQNMNEGAEIVVRWKDHFSSRKSEIQIATEDSFANVLTVKVSGESYMLKMAEPGMKFIRLRSLSSSDWPLSQFSNVETVEVKTIVPREPPKALVVEKKLDPEPEPEMLILESEPIQPKEKHQETMFYVWGGAGFDYLKFTQSSSVTTETGEFSTMTGPSTSYGANVRVSEKSNIEFQYHDLPGKISKTGATAIDKDNFSWKTMSLDYQRKISSSKDLNYTLLLGVQTHQTPFLSTDDTNGVVNLVDNEMTNASVGMKINYIWSPQYEYEFMLRYQSVLSSKSMGSYDFSAKSNLMFDGSVGLSRHFDNGFKMGVYWFGQYQDLKYDFTRSGATTSGTQNFLNSNVEIRFGWEFFGLFSIFPAIGRGWRRRKK